MGSSPEHLKVATAAWFDEVAPQWPTGTPADLPAMVAQLDCPAGGLILDAGCGNGVRGIPLAKAGYRVHGVDLAPEMVARASQAARQRGLDGSDARFEVGDVEALPVEDRACDGIICVNVLDFTPHPGVALTEFARVLKPGGRLLLSMLGAASPVKLTPGSERWRRFLPDPPTIIPGNDILPWEMEALLVELGWQVLDQQPRVGRTVRGPASPYSEAMVSRLPDRLLQQAVATAWQFVATPQSET